MGAVLGKRPDENVRPAALRTVPQRAEELEEGTGTQSSRQARARALRHRVRSRLGAVRLPAGRSGPDRTAAAQLPLHPLAATAATARTAGARVTVLEAAGPSLLRVAPVHEWLESSPGLHTDHGGELRCRVGVAETTASGGRTACPAAGQVRHGLRRPRGFERIAHPSSALRWDPRVTCLMCRCVRRSNVFTDLSCLDLAWLVGARSGEQPSGRRRTESSTHSGRKRRTGRRSLRRGP